MPKEPKAPHQMRWESRVNIDDGDVLSLNLFQKRVTQNVHPARQNDKNDKIRRRGQHNHGNIVIVVVSRLAWVGLEIGL